jgi:DNA-directed RNA polymerase specialized sigma subunit
MIKYDANDIKNIRDEYYLDFNDIFNDDSDIYRKLIKIIETKITAPEKIIILMYAELQSIKKVGDVLGVCPSTAYNELRRIKNKIKEWL